MVQAPKLDWADLDFEKFRVLARDPTLSMYERIGFPDSYRGGFEDQIFADIRAKLPRLEDRRLQVMDIGPGCSDLPRMLIKICGNHHHNLTLIDSAEMLTQLPDGSHIDKRPGQFPKCREQLVDLTSRVDVILCYSVLHYVFVDANVFDFVDLTLQLLAPGGECLIGDIPNVSKRRRFFASDAGVAYHQAFTRTDTLPEVPVDGPVARQIDDAVILSLLARARAAGADAYVVPQHPAPPMANRREDILIRKP